MNTRRRALAAIASCVALASSALAADAGKAHGPYWGLHGMLLFGGPDGLYASHLPMFHAPHDRQVVLALRLSDAALDARLRRELGAVAKVWTLVPEQFDLSRLAPDAADPLTGFSADIVEGHFERHGVTRHRGVKVEVVKVERFVALDADSGPGTEASYAPIGSGSTWFLVKELHARPDFDHVVAVRGPQRPERVVVGVKGIGKPSDAAIRKALPADDRLVGTVYYDVEDLK